MTIPKYAAIQAKQLLAARPLPKTVEEHSEQNATARSVLLERYRLPIADIAQLKSVNKRPVIDGSSDFVVSYASGIELPVSVENGKKNHTVMLLNLDGAEAARKTELYAALKESGVTIVTFDLRATGKSALASERVGKAIDHHSAEWGLWLGAPLFAQWLQDVHNVIYVFQTRAQGEGGEITVIGEGPAGLIALGVGARQESIVGRVAAVNALASFTTDEPYTNQRLGTIVPGILRDLGDVGHLAALTVGKRVVIGGGVSSTGKNLTAEQLKVAYEPAMHVFKLLGKEKNFILTEPANVLKELGLTTVEEKNDNPIFEPGAKLTKLSEDGAGGEGPAWDPKLGVLTSGSKGIHQLTPDGRKLIFREKAGTNGLLFDREGRLNCCEPDLRRMTRIDRDGKLTVLTDNFEGKKYNQPNDLTFDSRNRLYFSDPRYGSREDMQIRDEKGNTIEAVYRIDLDGKVSRVIGREVERANGVLVSPDDRYLFVADNNNDNVGGARKLYRFDLKPDGTIDPKSRKLLYDWGKGRGPDGVKQDAKGRLYVAAGLNKPNPPAEPATDVKGGIYVIDPESGKLQAFLAVPTDEVTNCAFGGSDLMTLYITGGGTLYNIRTTTPGRVLWPPLQK
jgi:gluconolactonase